MATSIQGGWALFPLKAPLVTISLFKGFNDSSAGLPATMATQIVVLLMLLTVLMPYTHCEHDVQTLFNMISKLNSSANVKDIPGVDPEAAMNFCEIVDYYGYKCEEYLHEVVTEDGFLLTMHRVGGKNTSIQNTTRPPIFLQHALLADSTAWVFNLPNGSLAFAFADAGFDVWLGNSRGNTYSRAHQTLKEDSDAFWAWSWDQMAEYDLPASIDFVLKHTGHEKLYYIGHSQGTLIGFAHLATSHTTKIAEMIVLAPIFKLTHMISPLKYLAPEAYGIADLLKLVGIRDFFPNSKYIRVVADDICNKAGAPQEICAYVLFLMSGFDSKQFNQTRTPVYLSHIPAGTSVRNMLHFAQMCQAKDTRKYDFGSAEENVRHYGTPTPPAYNLSNIATAPVSMYWAQNDWLADRQDVAYITANVKTLIRSVYFPGWEHMDFIWAKDAKAIFYDDLIHRLLIAS